MMWVIFLGSGMVFGIAALVLAWIGSRVILSIRRQQKKFEIEDETYNKVKEAMYMWTTQKRIRRFHTTVEHGTWASTTAVGCSVLSTTEIQ